MGGYGGVKTFLLGEKNEHEVAGICPVGLGHRVSCTESLRMVLYLPKFQKRLLRIAF